MPQRSNETLEHAPTEGRTSIVLARVGQEPGDTAFAIAFALAAIFLLAQIGEQTKWVNGVDLLLQPRFWPALCLTGLVAFATGYAVSSALKLKHGATQRLLPAGELLNWLRPVEYVLYFMAYVFCVPLLGYLPATLIVLPLLCLRAGYRNKRLLLASLVVGVAIVLIFKTMLQVKIPGGQAYELLPESIRSIFIANF